MQKQLLAAAPAGKPGFAKKLRIGLKTRMLAASLLAAGGVLLTQNSQAQTTVLNEGFEAGAGTWTLQNGTETNKWFIGTAAAATGTNSAYIDNGTGATNAYTITTPSVVHLYRDVTFPAGQGVITLSFKWKAQGEGTGTSDYDNMKVFVTNTSTAVAAGTEMPAADKVGSAYYNFSSGTGYTTTTILLPASYAGTSKRLVFSWKNDNSTGTQPPVSVDDIVITTRAASPITGTYTINNTLPTGGTNFASFTDAIGRINLDGISGAVTFNVSAGQSFAEDGLVITGTGTATNTIMFQKSGTGANPMIRPTGTSASNEAGIIISGGDYITFDGIDINIATGSAVEYGYVVRNASATNGALNNTIRNASITLNRTNTSSIAVLQTSSASFGAGTLPTAASGTNQNNTYSNLTIQNVYNGALLVSGTGFFPDNNNMFSGSTVGGTTAADLGNSGSTAGYGIKATLQSNFKAFNNEVRNSTVSGTTVDGIFIDQAIGLNEVYNNMVHDLRNAGTTSTSAVVGMRLNTFTSTAGNTIRAYNNFVYGLSHAFTGTASASRRVIGIFAQSNGTGVGNTHNIDFNSVRIENPATYTASSTAFEIGTTSGPTINVRNNIFADFTAAQTGVAKHYTWVSTSASLLGASGSVSDYNLLYVANATNGFIGLTNTTDRATLAAWRAATAQDLNSKSSNPQFISATNLHINPAVATEVESGGSFMGGIAWAANDIDANVRNTTTPDIGADEGTFTPSDLTGPSITINPLLGNTSSTANRTFTATITDLSGVPTTGTLVPRVYFSKGGTTFFSAPGTLTSGTATNGTWTFTIDNSVVGGVANGDRMFYFVVAQDINGNTNSTPAGNATVTNVNTVTNITSAYAYYINPAITGTITVPGTYPSLTLAGGLFDAINKSAISGNVTVNITADLTAETGAISLGQWSEEGTGNYTLTIRPDAAVNRTISGTSAAGFGLIRSNGADRFTMDGSFNGSGNFLTIIDNGAVANTFALLVTNGSVNNTFKNLNIKTGANTIASTIGIFVAGIGNNNLLLENNVITKAYQGISVQNDGALPSTGLIIRGNTIGSTTAADYVSIRGLALQNAPGALITKNTLLNIATTTIGTDNAGINLDVNMGNSIVSQNTITGMRSQNTGGWGSWGINISSNVGTDNITLANNMISDIMTINYSTSSTQYNAFGIRITGGNNHKIYYNSVNLFGNVTVNATTPAAPLSSAFIVTSATISGLDIRNNIFANTTTGMTGFKSYAIYLAAATNAATLDYNDYFVSTTAGSAGIIGFLTSDRLTLADWRTATGKDVNSKSADPQFTSPTDLHISATNAALNNAGTPIAAVTTDFDDDTRSTTAPEIGADEIATVAAAPTVTAGGATTFCTGGSVVLTAASTTTGATFIWQLNGTAIPGATSNTYTATTSGSYTAVATPGGASTPIVVTVNAPAATPTVTAAGSTTICAGSSVALTAASTTTGATFTWFLNGTAITGATSATYTANAAGAYTAVATTNGCPSAASTATTVTVNTAAATPTITAGGSTTICAGSSVVLTAASTTTGATYTWFLNGTAIPTATSATYTANAAGSYTAVATANGCASTASTATTVTSTLR